MNSKPALSSFLLSCSLHVLAFGLVFDMELSDHSTPSRNSAISSSAFQQPIVAEMVASLDGANRPLLAADTGLRGAGPAHIGAAKAFSLEGENGVLTRGQRGKLAEKELLPLPGSLSSSIPAPTVTMPVDEGVAGLERFMPVAQADTRPVAIDVGELEPDWLESFKGAAVATVSVYIESDGSVFYVAVKDESDPRIGELVRNAFVGARFSPGKVQGANVATRMDIQIDYESQRERVRSPDAFRSPDRVLSNPEIKSVFRFPEDKPQLNVTNR